MTKKKSDSKIDAALFERLQPKGGINFSDPVYIKDGTGYTRVIHIFGLPKNISNFYLDRIYMTPGSIVTVDVKGKDTATVQKNINKSLLEEYSRKSAATNFAELYSADERQSELENLYAEISSFGEIAKDVDIRIFVSGKTLSELEERCSEIISNLEGSEFSAATYLSEGKREWESLFEPLTVQQEKVFAAKPIPLLSEQIAKADPYNYSELIDPMSDFLGFTSTDGVVLFNEFTKTKTRKYYNGIVCGDLGSGKSTFLKKRFKANAAKGNYIRCFDASGEFAALTREFGGKIIKCGGSNSLLNPLEILSGGEDDSASYSRHISKVITIFRAIVPSCDDVTVAVLENLLRELYKEFNLLPGEGISITKRPARSYPTFSDLKNLIERKLKDLSLEESQSGVVDALNKDRALILSRLAEHIESICNSYGHILNGVTSMDNITDEKIVCFDISDVKDLGNVFVAIMYNMLSLCWDNAVRNGQLMKKMWEQGEIDIEDVLCTLILCDEAHLYVNTRQEKVLTQLMAYLREARRNFCGFWFASQSVRDFTPEGMDKNVDLLKTLFELTQYKFMFRQDSAALPLIEKVFGNSLTYKQVEDIPYFEVGEAVLSIAGDKNFEFKVWLSKEYEEQLFGGGR